MGYTVGTGDRLKDPRNAETAMTDTTLEAPVPAGPLTDVELAIGGVTCASSAARLERKLEKHEGGPAPLNYPPQKEKVSLPAGDPPPGLGAAGGPARPPRRQP